MINRFIKFNKKLFQLNYDKIYYYCILLFALILPLSRAGISFFIILLPLIWVIEGDFKRKFEQIKSNKFLVILSLFLIYSGCTILWSSNTDSALNIIRLNSYLLTVFVIATSLKKEYIPNIINLFLLGIFISEVIAYGVFFELWQFKYATPQNPSPFMMHIDYSVFLAFTSILLLNKLLSKHYHLREKLIFFFFFLTVTGNLFLATGRTGQISFIIAVVFLAILHFRFSFKAFIISLVLLSVLLSTAYNISDSFKGRVTNTMQDFTLMKNNNFNGSWGVRVAYWLVTYNILKDEPMGVGIGDFELAIENELNKDKYSFLTTRTKKFMSGYHPHNQYLLILIQLGLVGLLFFVYVLYKLFKIHFVDNEFQNIVFLFIVVYGVGCLAEPLLAKQFTLSLFVIFVGLFSNSEINQDRKQRLK